MRKTAMAFLAAAGCVYYAHAGVLTHSQEDALEETAVPAPVPVADAPSAHDGAGLIRLAVSGEVKNRRVLEYLDGDFGKDRAFAEGMMSALLGAGAQTVLWEIKPRPAPDEAGAVTIYPGTKTVCEVGENIELMRFKTLAFHENGHAVFYQYRSAAASQTEDERRLAQATVFAAKKRLEQNGELGKDYFSKLTPEEKTAFRIVELNKRAIIAHHELIADAFSVVVNRNPKVGNRDFSNLDNLDLADKDYHHYFDEVRYYVWSNYLKDCINDGPRAAEIFNRLAKAASLEAEELYKTIKSNYFALGNLDIEPSKVLDKLGMPPRPEANARLNKKFGDSIFNCLKPTVSGN